MLAYPPHLAIHDVPHLGVLFRRTRDARGLSQTDIARALDVTTSTVSKFESTGRTRRAQIIDRYIHALQSNTLNGTHLLAPLTQEDATLLRQLSVDARMGNSETQTAQLSAYDFSLITSPHAPPKLKALAQQLRQTPWPAFIADRLWFIHAVNGALLNLFDIAPDSPLLRQWESWHMIAAQFTAASPVRNAYISPANSFPPVICAFFRATLPYLFTPQMRALLRRIHQFSHAYQTYFSGWWYLATAFNLAFETAQTTHALHHNGRSLVMQVNGMQPQFIPISAKMNVPYYLGIWQPPASESRATLARISGAASPDELYFAADYDARQRNHVNGWPEIKEAFTQSQA